VAPLFHYKGKIRLACVCAGADTQEIDDLVLQIPAPSGPPPGAGNLFDAGAKAAESE